MYNGIGLSSTRGSATSGFVQSNRSHVRNNRMRNHQRSIAQESKSNNQIVSSTARQRGNTEIQNHEEKRRLENQLLEFRLNLEETRSDLKPEEIDRRVQLEREKHTKRLSEEVNEINTNNSGGGGYRMDSRGYQNCGGSYRQSSRGYQSSNYNSNSDHFKSTPNSHAKVASKEGKNERLRQAFGISKETYVEGSAFDQKLQEEKRRQIQEEKEKKLKIIEKSQRKKERETKRLEKDRRNDSKNVQKKMRGRSKNRRERSRSHYSSRSSSSSSSSSSNNNNLKVWHQSNAPSSLLLSSFFFLSLCYKETDR